MKSKWVWTILLVVLGAVVYVGTVLATPATQFTSATLAKAQLDELKIKGQSKADHWQVKLKTKGSSDMYVQSNVWAPGGSSGWHTHPGPSLITVTAGEVTVYDGDDPTCTPHRVLAEPERTRSWTSAAETSTSFATKARWKHAPSSSSSFRPTPSEGSTRRLPANCPF